MPEPSVNNFKLARSSQFTARLQYLLCRYAKSIAQGSGSQSPESKALAGRVLSDPGRYAGLIALSLVSDGGVSGSITGTPPDYVDGDSSKTDGDLDGVINAIWTSGAWNSVI